MTRQLMWFRSDLFSRIAAPSVKPEAGRNGIIAGVALRSSTVQAWRDVHSPRAASRLGASAQAHDTIIPTLGTTQ